MRANRPHLDSTSRTAQLRWAGASLRRVGFALACAAVACCMTTACSEDTSGSSDAGDTSTLDSGTYPAADGGNGALPSVRVEEVNEAGFAIQGHDVHPPLYRRVEARPCPANWESQPACQSDADCGAGRACVCGPMSGAPLGNTCIDAECLSDADCDGGCLLSDPSSAASGNPSPDAPRLLCARAGSLCWGGGDCVGNGVACGYVPERDRFECVH